MPERGHVPGLREPIRVRVQRQLHRRALRHQRKHRPRALPGPLLSPGGSAGALPAPVLPKALLGDPERFFSLCSAAAYWSPAYKQLQ